MIAVADLALLDEALRRGVRVLWDPPPRFRGPSGALALVKEVPDAARELLRRAAAFRHQLEAWTTSGRVGVPLLVLPEAPSTATGHCISCAAPLEGGAGLAMPPLPSGG